MSNIPFAFGQSSLDKNPMIRSSDHSIQQKKKSMPAAKSANKGGTALAEEHTLINEVI